MEKSVNIYLEILCLGILIAVTESNLFCRGDFEDYTFSSGLYGYFASDPSCWESTDPQFEVKARSDGSYSKTCDLVAIHEYILCQGISLSSGNFYSFSFDMLLSDKLISGSITATLNGLQILQTFISSGITESVTNSVIF